MKLYAVIYANYDAYWVEGVFSSEEKAMTYIRRTYPKFTKNMPHHISIEIWTLDEPDADND